MDAGSGILIGFGIAFAGYVLALSIERAAAKIREGMEAAARSTERAATDRMAGDIRVARINERSARYVARMNRGFIKKRVPEAERTEAEKLVDAFLKDTAIRLTDGQRWELEWAYGRLRGEDADQGSFSHALSTLRKYRAPLPDGITPEMIGRAIKEEEQGG